VTGRHPTGLVDLHAHFLPEEHRIAALADGQDHPDGMPALPAWDPDRAVQWTGWGVAPRTWFNLLSRFLASTRVPINQGAPSQRSRTDPARRRHVPRGTALNGNADSPARTAADQPARSARTIR